MTHGQDERAFVMDCAAVFRFASIDMRIAYIRSRSRFNKDCTAVLRTCIAVFQLNTVKSQFGTVLYGKDAVRCWRTIGAVAVCVEYGS